MARKPKSEKNATSGAARGRKKRAKFRSGMVAVIGRPNVGKSTLVNRLVGHKVSIVTSKPQTTRNRILGIVNRPAAQVVLIDTPGLHRADSALGRQMVSEIAQALEGIDLVVAVLDASVPIGEGDRAVLQRVAEFSGPAILVLNKIDRIPKHELLPIIEKCKGLREWVAIVPLSALKGDGVEGLLQEIIQHIPAGEPNFPTDQYTDQPERFLAAEIIREKAMAATKQEVPHSVAVMIESYEELPKLLRIRATIFAEREGQKGILIGRGGEMLKRIGTQARLELEEILGVKVFLQLFVKTRPGWRDDPSVIHQLDWRTQLEQLAESEADELDDEEEAAEPSEG